MLALLGVAIGLQALDFYTTYRGIKSGKAHEANPILAQIFNKLGLLLGLVVTKGAAVALSIAMYYIYPLILIPIIAFYLYIVYNNFKLIK